MGDLWAAAWSEGMYLSDSSSTSYATADFYLQTDDTLHHSENLGGLTANLNSGASKKIYLISSTYPGTYAKKGKIYYTISRQSTVSELSLLTQYGHTQLSVDPTVTISSSGSASLGLKFSFGVAVMASNSIHITSM